MPNCRRQAVLALEVYEVVVPDYEVVQYEATFHRDGALEVTVRHYSGRSEKWEDIVLLEGGMSEFEDLRGLAMLALDGRQEAVASSRGAQLAFPL